MSVCFTFYFFFIFHSTNLENGVLEVNTKTPANSTFDTRSVVDGVSAVSSVSTEDQNVNSHNDYNAFLVRKF